MVVISVVVSLGGSVIAQPGPGTWNTGFTIQNLSASTATVHVDFYDGTGVDSGDLDFSIPGNGSVFTYSGNIAGLGDGEYAATVASSQEVAVVVNLASSSPKSEAAYSGVSSAEAAPTLFAPGVYKNYYGNTSNIRVQNAGDQVTHVTVSYYAKGATTPTDTDEADLEPGAGVFFTQEDNASLPNGFIGSAVIASGNAQALAAIVNIVIPGDSAYNSSGIDNFGSYNTIIGGASQAYVPVLANNYYNYYSALTVMNLDDTDNIWVRVTYDDGNVSEKPVNHRASELWYTPNEGPNEGWFGSATVECITGQGGAVTTDCEIVATVNQEDKVNGGFASFNGFAQGATEVVLPIANKNYWTSLYYTSITCQNVSSDQTTDVSLGLTGGNTVPTQTNIGPNGKAFWYLPNYTGVADGFNGSATAAASNTNAAIVCIGQQNANNAAAVSLGDWLTTYNGISR
jgi:hypothetical protein